eukprot:15474067-Alexandrium_andersonii.AAC.1
MPTRCLSSCPPPPDCQPTNCSKADAGAQNLASGCYGPSWAKSTQLPSPRPGLRASGHPQ